MTVPPPGLFSTMTDRLSTLPSLSDNKRATESFAPPGANGTIKQTGRSGYSARTGADSATVARTLAAVRSFIMFRSLNPRPLPGRADEPLGVRDRHPWSAHILRRVFLNRDLIRSVHGVLRARSPSGFSKASLIERS